MITWAKVDRDPSLIPPTGFIADLALPPIFRPWAAIPPLDKQRGSIFLRAQKFHATTQVALGSFRATSF